MVRGVRWCFFNLSAASFWMKEPVDVLVSVGVIKIGNSVGKSQPSQFSKFSPKLTRCFTILVIILGERVLI